MCGIVGYVGSQQVVSVLLDTLSTLEYRGYDSAGISVFNDGKLSTVKAQGRLSNLEKKLTTYDFSNSKCGIGHTRWATHGEPSDVNAHPHCTSKLSLVHNGIIENYQEIKEDLIKKGYEFISATDTEVAAKLIDSLYNGDPVKTLLKAKNILQGSFAFAILFFDQQNTVYATRRGAPLIVAKGKDENFIASDVPAILKFTRQYILLEEDDIACVKKDKINIYDKDGNSVYESNKDETQRRTEQATWTIEQAQKNGYEHFMLKEIHEQPKVLQDTVRPRIKNGLPSFEEDSLPNEFWASFNQVYIVACGTAMHAGMVGKWLIENIARVPVTCDIASEFRYSNPILTKQTLVILISQSGETADTLAALRLAKERGAITLSIVNVTGSSIAREADHVIHTYAGPEIAVASTKAYSVQMAVMYLIAFITAYKQNSISQEECKKYIEDFEEALLQVKKVLSLSSQIQSVTSRYKDSRSLFFIGRGLDYFHAMEGALKMKEISYIHCESYAGGELKHGTISLITPNTGVIAIATQSKLLGKMVSNIKEVCSRGADVLLFAKAGDAIDPEIYSTRIDLPAMDDIYMPIVSIIPLQLLAYYTAVIRGCDVDKPRNLAKSVTVE